MILGLGCTSDEPIVTYQIPTAVPAALASEDTRMIAAILPQSKQAWFFKLMGRQSAIDSAETVFRKFVQNVTFEDGAPMLDELPTGWRRGSDRAMRFASINIETPTQQLDLSISQLARMDDWDKLVAMNVNRWRGQVGMEPSTNKWAAAEELERDVELEVDDKDSPAIWVDVSGRPDSGAPPMGGPMAGGAFAGQNAPFAQLAKDGDQPTAATDPHAGLPRTAREAIASGKMKAPGKATRNAKGEPIKIAEADEANSKSDSSDDDAESKLKYDRPDGWRDGRMSMMRMAAFNVGPEDSHAEVTVITAGGDLRGNVARWMGQIRQSAVPDEEVDAALEDAEKLKVGGREGQRFVLMPPTLEEDSDSDADSATAIDATIVPLESGFSLFIKMTGPSKIVKEQNDTMRAFITSLQF